MKRIILSLLFTIAFIIPSITQAQKTAALNWSDVTRDVYIDGEIDRSAQVLSSDSPRGFALISAKLDRAIILDVAERSVSAVSKEAFRFAADRASALFDVSAAAQPLGKYADVDNYTKVFAVEAKAVLIARHTGVTGEMSEQKLWETAPVWRSLMEAYQPASEAVAAIKSCGADTQVTIVFGTWCPDSKNYAPKLLKALRLAANNHIKVEFIGIDYQFHEPMGAIQQRRLINVPTVIVERNGREIGRIVETPAATTIEEDLAAILDGKPRPHNGRWARGAKIAQGVYSYTDAKGKEFGLEQWEMFNTAEGGRLFHSRITEGLTTTEVWHRMNANRQPTFIEITRQRGDDLTRARYSFDGQKMTVRLRGSAAGAIEQTITAPENLLSPAVASQCWAQASGAQGRLQVTSYIASLEPGTTAGAISQTVYEAKGEQSVRVPAGEFRAERLARKTEKESSHWWLHPQLGIPVRGKIDGGVEYTLTSLELAKN